MRRCPKLFPMFAFFWLGAWASAGGQTITTLVGNCTAGYTGDGGPATQATLSCPDDLAFDSKGNYYIADACSNTVRKVDITTGIITTYAGLYNPSGLPLAGDGGPATLAYLNYPSGIAFDSHNNLYIADYYNSVIRKVDAVTGIITTFAGDGTPGYSGDGGPATLAELSDPDIARVDPGGQYLYVSDQGNDTVRKISLSTRIITTVAGNGTIGYSGDGGSATLAALNEPEAMAWDAQGNLYIGDSLNSVIRKVDASTGFITTVVGTGATGFSGDGGPALSAEVGNDLGAIVFTCNGNMIFTDDMNNRVRMVDKTTGIVTTVMGTGNSGCSTSSTGVLTTDLTHPEALAYDPSGNLDLVDYGNNLVQEVAGGFCPATPTATRTATNSPTPTNTDTPTPTLTPTNTPTPTSSGTPTNTSTLTPTSTPSGTPTNTSTPTSTSTPTVTPTATIAIFLGKQVSKAQAQSGDNLTYTIGVTLSGVDLGGVVVTDTLPTNVTFVGISSASAGSATFYSATSLLGWTLPATLAPGIYSLSYQTKVDAFTPSGTQIVNGARLTFPGLFNPLTSSVTVQVTGQYTVRVGVYNEAGELIEELKVFQSSQAVNSLSLQGNSITRLTGPGGQIEIYSQGTLLAAWDGKGADGNPVSNGSYLIKANSIDPYGVVNTVTQQATVSRSLAKVLVDVYNEAGEVVKHLLAWVEDPPGTEMTNLVLNRSALRPGTPSNPSQPSTVQLVIETSGAPVTLAWDGTNDQGAYVSAGYYLLQAHWVDGQGGITDISRGLLVTAHDSRRDGTLLAQPNLLTPSSGVSRTTIKLTSGENYTLRADIYSLAGELASRVQGDSEKNEVSWDASGYASGIYLASVEILDANGGTVNRQNLKILVIR